MKRNCQSIIFIQITKPGPDSTGSSLGNLRNDGRELKIKKKRGVKYEDEQPAFNIYTINKTQVEQKSKTKILNYTYYSVRLTDYNPQVNHNQFLGAWSIFTKELTFTPSERVH